LNRQETLGGLPEPNDRMELNGGGAGNRLPNLVAAISELRHS
jgi:hypothetical protein